MFIGLFRRENIGDILSFSCYAHNLANVWEVSAVAHDVSNTWSDGLFKII